jgi:hypothetical protein
MKEIVKKCAMGVTVLVLNSLFSCTSYQFEEHLPPGLIPDNVITSACDQDTVYFRNSILPLVVSSCAYKGCHDQESHKEGIILSDYNSILRTGKIRPGDPGDSEFFESLTDDGDDLMPPPPNDPLTSEQIHLIRLWIEQGAKDNECKNGCDTSNVAFSETIWPVMQQYCTGCHNANNPGGGITIAGYEDLVALAENGTLLGSIRYEPGYSKMPTNQQLSECNIMLIQMWMDEGFPE